MRQVVIYSLSFLLSLISVSVKAAEFELEASTDRSSCAVGEMFDYMVTISGESSLPDFELMDFEDFQVVAGPSTSTKLNMVNSRITRSSSLSYTLRALKPGTFTISPAKAKHRKTTWQSNPVTIQVYPAGKPPQVDDPESGRFEGGQGRELPEVFISVKVDKDTVYRLDMVTVSYDLYFKVNVTNYAFPRLPHFTGFWQEDFNMPTRPVVRDVRVQGNAYKVATIRRVGLFPTRTGILTLEPLTADLTVELPAQQGRSRSRGWSIFDDPFFSRTRSETKTTTSQEIKLVVLPLPNYGKPAGFRDDVGQFNIRVDYDSRELTQHEAMNIRVTIAGSGYLKSIEAPDLDLPDGFEQFDPTVDDKISIAGQKMQGKKVFNYLVIPRVSGAFTLKPVILSYFDPELRKYRVTKGGGALINVKQSGESRFLADGGHVPEEVALLGRDIRFIKELDSPLIKRTSPVYQSPWFFVTFAISPLLFIFALGVESVVEKRMSDPDVVRRRKAPEKMRRCLAGARKKLRQDEYQAAVTLAAQGFAELVGAVIREPAAGLTRHIVKKGFIESDVDQQFVNQVIELLEKGDHVRFSGMELTREDASVLLEQYEKAGHQLEKSG